MSDWSRREVLKSAIALPAASALGVPGAERRGLDAGAADAAAASGAGRRERLLLDFGWRFHFGHANDADEGLRVRQRQSGGFQKTGELPLAEQPRPSTTATGRRWTCRTTGRSACRSRTTRALSSKGSYPLGRDYPETSVGWYRRVFELPASDAGRRITVEFDGVYRDAMVVVQRLLHRPARRRLRSVPLRPHRLRQARRRATCCWSAWTPR